MIKLTQQKLNKLKTEARFEQKSGFRYIKDRQYEVDSFTTNTTYVVDLDADNYVEMCSCPSRKRCKHIDFAYDIERFRNENERT